MNTQTNKSKVNFNKEKDILIMNTKNGKRDISNNINAIYYNKSRSQYEIHLSYNKIYNVNLKNVKIYYYKKTIDIVKNIILDGNKVLTNIKEVWEYNNNYYKIFFQNGNTKLAQDLNIKVNKSLLVNELFGYYKKLAQKAVALNNEDTSDIDAALCKLYESVDKVNEESILYKYLLGSGVISREENKNIIFPFKFNKSQNIASKNALTSNISIIKGPPGTGKTQVILNIIMNLVIRGKTVGVVSNNNTAISNIYELLEKEGLSFFLAQLGSVKNKNLFFDSKKYYEQLSTFCRNTKKDYIDYQFKIKLETINELYEMDIELIKIKNKISEIDIERKYYIMKNGDCDTKISTKKSPSSSKIFRIKLLIENSARVKLRERLFFKKVFKTKYDKKNQLLMLHILESNYYLVLKNELTAKATKIEEKLKNSNYEQLKNEYTLNSMNFFKDFLYDKYSKTSVVNFTKKNYLKNFKLFISRFPVILSTSHSLGHSAPANFLFDYLIFDEASQSDLLGSVISLHYAKNLVIVGDLIQLPAITDKELSLHSALVLEKEQVIPNQYLYKNNSILKSIEQIFPKAPKITLNEHYRCHPKIISFCNKMFYNDELLIMTEDKGESALKIIHTVAGNHAKPIKTENNGYSYSNEREATEISESIKKGYISDFTYGVIAPYNAQEEVIRDKINEFCTNEDKIKISTVHSFQGQERDIIYISFTLNNLYHSDFITDKHLSNVAVSRAKKQLVVVLSKDIYESKNNTIASLISHIKYYSQDVSEGNIVSVFDLLYSVNKEKLLEFRKTFSIRYRSIKNIIISEMLVYDKLHYILSKDYPTLTFTMHIRLSSFVNKYPTNQNEVNYLKHPNTHVDFLIYDKITRTIILIIEVDGVRYHKNNKKQLEHDRIKDECLKDNGLSILRLSTDQSNEKDRIVSSINEYYSHN